jgi:hypothetical protein
MALYGACRASAEAEAVRLRAEPAGRRVPRGRPRQAELVRRRGGSRYCRAEPGCASVTSFLSPGVMRANSIASGTSVRRVPSSAVNVAVRRSRDQVWVRGSGGALRKRTSPTVPGLLGCRAPMEHSVFSSGMVAVLTGARWSQLDSLHGAIGDERGPHTHLPAQRNPPTQSSCAPCVIGNGLARRQPPFQGLLCACPLGSTPTGSE